MDAIPTPTGLLREQHAKILEVADVLDTLIADEPRPGALDFEALADCVTFIRLYADALHHGKEEGLLFPELEAAGMPRTHGPLAVMLHEHALGRSYAASMTESLPRARAGDDAALQSLRGAARAYVALIRAHILKEDNVLFQVADSVLDRATCTRLCAAYEGVCGGRFEGCTVAELEAILERLRARLDGSFNPPRT